MLILHEFRKHAPRAALPLFCAAVISYFGYHAVHGDYGLLSYVRLTQQIAQLKDEAASVKAERLRLEKRAALMAPTGLDPDMLDERARASLGFIDPQDVILTDKR